MGHKFKWNLNNVKTEALKYSSRWAFQKGSKGAYLFAIKFNILDEVCVHMPKLVRSSWTKKDVLEEALKYQNRVDFKHSNQMAYKKATKFKILDEACAHMIYSCRKPYAEEELLEIAKKYHTRVSFRNSDMSSYNACVRRKILDKACAHMRRSLNASSQEVELALLIQEKFPKAQKLKDNTVKIENKPYIKGFDIDIYIPELRKGIEFDGIYWHSPEGLKRSREHWPEADLSNYSKLKDLHFLSKGIKILHINEKEWIKDKQNCICKCFNFLSET